MKSRRIIASVLAILAQGANAQGDAPVLAPGNRSLSVELPQAAFLQPGGLSIDLDGYDVSPFSRVEGATLRIELDTPLAAGRHSLSVLLFLPDGNAEVLLQASLEAPEIQGAQWSVNSTLQTHYRADQSTDADFQDFDRASANGALSLAGKDTSGRWRLASGVDAIYDRYNETAPTGDSWLLSTYDLSATYLGTTAETSAGAGNIAVARDDLLFSRFKRRGIAMESATTSGRFDLQMFSVTSTPRNGFDGGYLGPDDSNNYAKGVSASVRIVEDHLHLGGGFIDGETPFGGAGFNNQEDGAIYGGDSWNVAVDSRWLKGSVWLQLEHAESKFDADGIGAGLPAREDDATQARLRLSSMGQFGEGPFAYWSAAFLHKRVGLDFFSIGNLSQAGNIEINSALLQGGFDSIAVDIELTRQRSNPDDDPLLPRQTLRRAGIKVSYTPALVDPDDSLWKLLGVPSVSGWIYRSASRQPGEDAAIAGFDLDNTTDDAAVELAFGRGALSWGLTLGVVDFTDRSEPVEDGGYFVYEPPSDSRDVLASLRAGWTPNARMALDAYLERNRLSESDSDNEYRSTNYGLSSTFFLVPDRLSLLLSANQGEERSRFGDPQFSAEKLHSRFASTQLTWLVIPASGARPGLSLSVKGAYSRNEEPTFPMDEEAWSVHIGAALSWERAKR